MTDAAAERLREVSAGLLDALEAMQHSPLRNDDVAWAILLGGGGAAGELRAALAHERSAGAAPIDVDVLGQAMENTCDSLS